jgi:hypothetical protein
LIWHGFRRAAALRSSSPGKRWVLRPAAMAGDLADLATAPFAACVQRLLQVESRRRFNHSIRFSFLDLVIL